MIIRNAIENIKDYSAQGKDLNANLDPARINSLCIQGLGGIVKMS